MNLIWFFAAYYGTMARFSWKHALLKDVTMVNKSIRLVKNNLWNKAKLIIFSNWGGDKYNYTF